MNLVHNKIINLGEVKKKSRGSVVLCHGHFNIIHPGHIRYLDYARQQAKRLVVSVQGDKSFIETERKYHFTEEERAAGVASIQTVDQVIILGDGSLKNLIEALQPDVLVLGREFENELHNEVSEAIKSLKKFDGKVLFHAGDAHYASSDLLRENLPNLQEQNFQLFKQACSQQKFKFENILFFEIN